MSPVSVIVPARDAAATLGATLDALAAQELDDELEVIVVDDGSGDATAAIAEAHPVATVVRQARAGPAAARNAGVAASRGELLAFTDADCRPQPGWLAAGTEALTRLDLAQGRVVPDPAAARGPFDRTIAVDSENGLYETANLLIRREAFDQLGGFEDWLATDTGKSLGEDVWLGWRARRAGMRTGFAPAAVVHHAVFAQTAREYLAERARLRYFPALARRIPELRDERFCARLFVTRRSAAFDAAVAGVALAVATRRCGPLVAAVPVCADRCPPCPHRPGQATVEVAADAVGLSALVRGSWAARRPLL